MSVKSIQAPIGGVNRLASIDDMPESDAWILDNWIPDAGFCRLRGGTEFCNIAGLPAGPIETLVEYGDQLLVCVGGEIWDTGLTPGSPTSGSPTQLGTGFGSNKWETEVFNNVLILVNGVDAPQGYDGSTLAPLTIDGTVPNPEEFIGVNSFKGRAIYWKDEAAFWYAEAGSYQGILSEFDVSIYVNKFTSTNTMFTWSADAGDGPDDFFVLLMNSGEALVYQGTDPSSLDFFALVGKFQMDKPLSLRSNTSIAGDQIILTKEGWNNFKTVWETGNFRDEGIGRKIVGLSTQAADEFASLDGWEVDFYPDEKLVIVNVPQGAGVSIQHVLNTNTYAWCTFSGWSATTFGSYQGRIYFGTIDGEIYLANEGTSDAGGLAIVGDALPAFNYLSGRANNKQLTGLKPITTMSDPDNIGLVGTADFFIPAAPNTDFVPFDIGATPWGSPWGSPWSTGSRTQAVSQWETLSAFGYAVSYRMVTKTAGERLEWGSTQMMFKDAGVI